MRPDQHVRFAQRSRPAAQRLQPGLDHLRLVVAHGSGRSEVEHDRLAGVETVAGAERRPILARLQLEEAVPVRRADHHNPLLVDAVQLDRLAAVDVVPGVQAVGNGVQPALVRETVPAVDGKPAPDPEQAGRLHDLGLVKAGPDHGRDQDGVGIELGEVPDDAWVRGEQLLELRQRCLEVLAHGGVDRDRRVGPARVSRTDGAAGGGLEEAVERPAAVERAYAVLGAQVPEVVARPPEQIDGLRRRLALELDVALQADAGVGEERLRHRPLLLSRGGGHDDLRAAVGELDREVDEPPEGEELGEERDAHAVAGEGSWVG